MSRTATAAPRSRRSSPEHDRRRRGRDRRDVDLAAAHDDARPRRGRRAGAPTGRAPRRRGRPPRRRSDRPRPRPLTCTRSSPSRSRAPCASSSVSASRSTGVVAARLDPRGERELVEQLRHLRRGLPDHLDVAVGRRLELDRPLERLREAVHGRERRADVVAARARRAGRRRCRSDTGFAAQYRGDRDDAPAARTTCRPRRRRCRSACRAPA